MHHSYSYNLRLLLLSFQLLIDVLFVFVVKQYKIDQIRMCWKAQKLKEKKSYSIVY